MRVKDLMSAEVITVEEESSIARARRLMTQRGVSALPVVNGDGHLVGIVSSRDFLGMQPDEERVPVSTLMQRRVHSLSGDADVSQLARVMGAHGLHHVVVVGSKAVHGIVSSLDLLKVFGEPKPKAKGDAPTARFEDLGLTLLDSSPAGDDAHAPAE